MRKDRGSAQCRLNQHTNRCQALSPRGRERPTGSTCCTLWRPCTRITKATAWSAHGMANADKAEPLFFCSRRIPTERKVPTPPKTKNRRQEWRAGLMPAGHTWQPEESGPNTRADETCRPLAPESTVHFAVRGDNRVEEDCPNAITPEVRGVRRQHKNTEDPGGQSARTPAVAIASHRGQCSTRSSARAQRGGNGPPAGSDRAQGHHQHGRGSLPNALPPGGEQCETSSAPGTAQRKSRKGPHPRHPQLTARGGCAGPCGPRSAALPRGPGG